MRINKDNHFQNFEFHANFSRKSRYHSLIKIKVMTEFEKCNFKKTNTLTIRVSYQRIRDKTVAFNLLNGNSPKLEQFEFWENDGTKFK
jgi:hypothetical protein